MRVRVKPTLVGCWVLALTALTSSILSAAPSYRLSLLDLPKGATDTLVRSLSDSGLILGSAFGVPGTNGLVSAVWSGSSLLHLDAVNTIRYASAINAAGQVSCSGTNPATNTGYAAFRWSLDTGRAELLPSTGYDNDAVDINDFGIVVGYEHGMSDVRTRAVLWNTSGPHILTTPEGLASTTTSINNLGQVAGSYALFTYNPDGSANAFISAVVWDPAGLHSVLPADPLALPGTTSTTAISNAGVVLGYAAYPNPDGSVRSGFLRWNSPDAPPTLMAVPDGHGFITNLNSAGLSVADFWTPDYASVDGYLLDGSDYYKLSSLIDDTLGLTQLRAADINDTGQIVGTARLGDSLRAFILTPIPEPALLSPALTILPLLRRQRPHRPLDA